MTARSIIPTGTVTFYDGMAVLGTETLNSSGAASLTTSTLPLGDQAITAVYSGDAFYSGNTSHLLDQEVDLAATNLGLSSSDNPSAYRQSVTFTAAVTADHGTPTGTVTFYDGGASLDTETLDANGYASFTISSLLVGDHDLSAAYSGDSSFDGSTSDVLSQEVDQPVSSVGLNSSSHPSEYGQPVTFTATVYSTLETAPTGTITFDDGSTALDTETANAFGVASFTISALSLGEHPLTAVYSGDGTTGSSTSYVLTQVVSQATTTVGLSSSLNPSDYGQDVTFTAIVTPAYTGTPTGTVSFYDGATLLDMETLAGTGTAAFTTSMLTGGYHSLTAVYSGDGNFSGSTALHRPERDFQRLCDVVVLRADAHRYGKFL